MARFPWKKASRHAATNRLAAAVVACALIALARCAPSSPPPAALRCGALGQAPASSSGLTGSVSADQPTVAGQNGDCAFALLGAPAAPMALYDLQARCVCRCGSSGCGDDDACC